MIKTLIAAYRESWASFEGKRLNFIFLLLPMALLKIMSPLIIPIMLRLVFDAMETGNGEKVLISVGQSSLAFIVLFMIIYFINIYGDALATRIGFYGMMNRYSSFFDLPVCQLIAKYSKGEIYNRIKAGCNNSLHLWFKTIDLVGSFAAVVGLLFLASLISPIVLGVVSLLVISNFMITLYLAHRNKIFTRQIQGEEDTRLELLHSFVYDSRFIIMNHCRSFVGKLYNRAREKRFQHEYQQIKTNEWLKALMDTLAAGYHSLLGLVLFYKKRDNSISLGEISSASTIFTNLRQKSGQLAKTTSNLPNSVVPIRRMKELLEQDKEDIKIQKNNLAGQDNSQLLSMKDVSLDIKGKTVLKNIDFDIHRGEKIAIVGKNGSGKSTLMKMLAGQYQHQRGEIVYLNQDDRWISYIPAASQLFPKQTVLENVKMGATSEQDDKIPTILSKIQIGDRSFTEKKVSNISGGEAQRVNISRAMIGDKQLLLADEPTASLDNELADKVMDYLLSNSKTMVYVTHNPAHALKADRILYIEDGRIAAQLSPSSAERNELFLEWAGLERLIV